MLSTMFVAYLCLSLQYVDKKVYCYFAACLALQTELFWRALLHAELIPFGPSWTYGNFGKIKGPGRD